MRTRREDKRNTRSAGPVSHHFGTPRGRGAPRGRGRGSPAASPSPSRSAMGRSAPARRGAPARADPTSPGRTLSAVTRGRPPGRPRGRGRGRGAPPGRGRPPPSSHRDDDDDNDDEQEDELALRRVAVESSASASSTSEGEESGEDLLTIEGGRGSRKRQLPARFRDSPLVPLVRRRTVSTGSTLADKPASPEKPAPAPQRLASASPLRSPEKMRSPPSIAEKIEREEARAQQRTSLEKTSPELVIDVLQDVIDMDHGIHRHPPLATSPPRKRQRVQSRSAESEHVQMKSGQLFQHQLQVEEPGQQEVLMQQDELDDDDLITMELDSMEVPVPMDNVPRRPCKVCHRQLKVTNIKQHMLTHTGQRPFKCEVCSAAFTRRSDVFRHVKIIHQQEKPFKCVKDGKEFSDRKGLKAHMEQHKRPALFACKVCDFRFGKFEYYVNHVKFIHPTGEPLPNFPEDVEPEPEPVAPPRGRYGPTPLQAYLDDDDDDSQPGGLEQMGEQLQMSGGLESIETEEIPHDSMHLVAGGAGDSDGAADCVPDVQLHETVVAHADDGHGVAIGAPATPGGQPMERAHDKDDSQEQIDFPPLEEDAAAILGMTDLALTNENTSLQSSPALEEVATPLERSTTMPGGVTTAKRHPDPLISTRPLSQPRVVTIGKSVMASSSAVAAALGGQKTVLLTRPRIVAGKQVLQAVKLGAGQKIVSARAPGTGRGGLVVTGRGGSRQPIMRQVVINRPVGGAPRVVTTTRVVRPAVRPLPLTGSRTLTLAAGGAQVTKTVSPAIRVVRPAAPPPPPPPPPEPPHIIMEDPVSVAAAAPPADDTKNIEVTTSTAGGSRTIILQTSGGGGDILQSEEAMQTLLEAVQQLVSASGDTLEGKQIEIVMQNDSQPAAADASTSGSTLEQ